MNRAILAVVVSAAVAACAPAAGRESRHDVANESAVSRAIPRRTGFATASDGVPIYYEVCGAGPAIVLVHGLGGNHAVWFQQVAHFAAAHTVVTLSQRGFAPSGGRRDRYDGRQLVSDLRAVLVAAGVGHAVVVGQSMGGWTALGLALESPEFVDALVLADTTGGISDETIDAHLREIGAAAAKLRRQPPPFGAHPALASEFSREHPELGYLYQTLSTFGAPAPDVITGQLFRTRFDAGALRTLTVPTLFVVGGRDPIFPPAIVEHAATLVPVSVVATIEDAGHSPYFERPREWNSVVAGAFATH